MARALGEALEIETPDELPEVDEFRKPNEFELTRLAHDPCLPVYISADLERRIRESRIAYWRHFLRHPKALPITASREFVRSEGSV